MVGTADRYHICTSSTSSRSREGSPVMISFGLRFCQSNFRTTVHWIALQWRYTVLYSTVLHYSCTVLYWIALLYICTVLYSTVLPYSCTVLYWIVLLYCCTVLYSTVLPYSCTGMYKLYIAVTLIGRGADCELLKLIRQKSRIRKHRISRHVQIVALIP